MWDSLGADTNTSALPPSVQSTSKVAITQCKTSGPEVKLSLAKCFDLLGGIGGLVKGTTVTVKKWHRR